MQVSFIGLGVMGYPMAGHLQQAGHSVSVYNRTAAKAQAWQQTYGGKTAATPAEAAAGADIIFVCVGLALFKCHWPRIALKPVALFV